jgi:hypothetical protein
MTKLNNCAGLLKVIIKPYFLIHFKLIFLNGIKDINKLHREIPVLNQDEVKRIDKKLSACYNLANDPRSKM